MRERPEYRLADLCDSIDYGYTASARELPVGPRFLRITDIVSGRLDWKSVPHCEIAADDTPTFRLHHGDVVIARTGATTGVSAYSANPPEAVFASYLVRLKVGSKADFRFSSYFLKSEDFWDYMRGVLGDKSAQPNASARTMTQVKLRLPPLPEQRAIAGVLEALDDKIELNRRMNETLEALAQSLFKSWFVDACRRRARRGRQATQAALPKGWPEGTLGEVAENPRRGVHPNEIEPATPDIGLEHMPRRGIALSDWGRAEEMESNKFEFKRGEILFGKLRPYFHKVGVAPLDGVCSSDILVVRPKEPEWFGFVLGHVSSLELVNHTDAASTGTKMPHTNWNDISRFEVALPPKELAAAFSERIRPLVERMISHIHESHTLATLRDALPRKRSGLSGAVRIRGMKS